ncbi:MAG: AAA family ATPase [Clostridia bacterium]|nr:AAA family ATPase [Clostridia bacterium]
MKETKLFGREEECRKLRRCLRKTEAQLVVVYGRRRVGKTFLINEFFEKRFDFKLTGSYNATKESQLENFTLELNRRSKVATSVPRNWKEAFEHLQTYLSGLPADEKHVVFFDEMPWMDTNGSDFLPSFEYFWNSFGNSCDHLVFIVCGSATSWMVENIDRNKGGLFSRKTCSLHLEPFTLGETEVFLRSLGIDWSRYDIAQCYMIMGGIPYYLGFLDEELSLSANIDRLFFSKGAELGDEFDNLFRTLFKHSEQYIKIAEILSQKRYGMTKKELAQQAGMSYNGEFSQRLKRMTDAGFIHAISYYRQKKKETRYQLSDYFTMFYFRFAKDHYGVDESYWTHTYDNPSRVAWAGLIFEQLCRDHLPQIKQRLGISGVLTEASTWRIKAEEDREEETGAQIDMVLDRRDHVISLCEAKYSQNVYEIDKAYDLVLRNKVEAFRKATGTTKSLQLVVITTYGVKQNKYSNQIQGQVVLDDLFEKER